MPAKSIVAVKISRENGWYVATSADLEGLIVCHQNRGTLAQEIPLCIKQIFKLDHGMDVDVDEAPLIDSPGTCAFFIRGGQKPIASLNGVTIGGMLRKIFILLRERLVWSYWALEDLVIENIG